MQFLFRFLKTTAWWAPVAVLILHKLVGIAGLRTQADWLMHFSGGLAITIFLWSFVPIVEEWLGKISRGWRLLAAFAGGCSTAAIWEIKEFASDQMWGTEIQKSLVETMLDLSFSVGGAAVVVLGLVIFSAVVRRRGGNSESEIKRGGEKT